MPSSLSLLCVELTLLLRLLFLRRPLFSNIVGVDTGDGPLLLFLPGPCPKPYDWAACVMLLEVPPAPMSGTGEGNFITGLLLRVRYGLYT